MIMKYALFFCMILMLFFTNCNDDAPNNNNNNNFPACNNSTDPANEIGWIRNAIDDNQNLNEDAHIICYELDGRLVFLVDYCVPCGDGYDVYDCEQQPVCTDNQNGNSTCDYFVSNAVNEILIWRNF